MSMEYIDDTDCWVWGIKNMSIFSNKVQHIKIHEEELAKKTRRRK